jgi:hypothetical protein
MATLTVRYDIPAPRFVHGFVYEGEQTERAALKEAMRKVAVKAGIDTRNMASERGHPRSQSSARRSS